MVLTVVSREDYKDSCVITRDRDSKEGEDSRNHPTAFVKARRCCVDSG